MVRRRGRAPGRRAALAAAALAVAAAGAAVVAVSTGLVVIDPTRRPAAAGPDTSAGALDRAAPARDSATTGLPAPPTAPPPDSAAGGRDSLPHDSLPGEPVAGDSLPGGTAAPGATGSGARTTATPVELAALAATLGVPVAGVGRDRLVDSFDDARGARSADGRPARRHDAIDILAPRGTPVVAATGGRVLKLFDSRLGGLTVYTTDESGRFVLLYGHLDRYAPGVREGRRVERGDTLGFVGTTGDANPATPHLHFAIARTDTPDRWWEGTPVNPYPLLRGAPAGAPRR